LALGLSAEFAKLTALTQNVKHTLLPCGQIVKALVPKLAKRFNEAENNDVLLGKKKVAIETLVEAIFFDALRCAGWSKNTARNLIRDAAFKL
jgi:hypothetical protein